MNVAQSLVKKVQAIPLPKSARLMKLKLQKHSPDIMIVVGTGLVIGSAIYACKKTMEAHDILEQATEELEKIEYGVEVADGDEGVIEASRKDRAKVYRKVAVGMAKCYGPSVIGGATGFGLIFGAHKILKDRNTALGIAYANLLASYNNYRAKVRETYGDDQDVLFHSGGTREDVKFVDENGEDQTASDAIVMHDDGSGHSLYARVFDEYNINWRRSPSDNLFFLKQQQQWANDKLRSEGFVFLNDVYQALGFPRTSDGQIVGWMWDPRNELDREETGDNYIDFGIFDSVFKSAETRDFINGINPCVWLDFNVDGPIYKLI